MKTCIKCNIEKPETDFYENWYVRKDDTKSRMRKCKSCSIATSAKQRDGSSRQAYLAYQKSYQKQWGQKNRRARLEWLDKIKSRPCLDCGNSYPPECMDFDHIDPKTKSFSVSGGAVSGRTKDALLAEIAKCRLICANCHRIRTAQQYGRRRY